MLPDLFKDHMRRLVHAAQLIQTINHDVDITEMALLKELIEQYEQTHLFFEINADDLDIPQQVELASFLNFKKSSLALPNKIVQLKNDIANLESLIEAQRILRIVHPLEEEMHSEPSLPRPAVINSGSLIEDSDDDADDSSEIAIPSPVATETISPNLWFQLFMDWGFQAFCAALLIAGAVGLAFASSGGGAFVLSAASSTFGGVGLFANSYASNPSPAPKPIIEEREMVDFGPSNGVPY